eukprot:2843561-Pleurochrysis_carterae.AAC.1
MLAPRRKLIRLLDEEKEAASMEWQADREPHPSIQTAAYKAAKAAREEAAQMEERRKKREAADAARVSRRNFVNE